MGHNLEFYLNMHTHSLEIKVHRRKSAAQPTLQNVLAQDIYDTIFQPEKFKNLTCCRFKASLYKCPPQSTNKKYTNAPLNKSMHHTCAYYMIPYKIVSVQR